MTEMDSTVVLPRITGDSPKRPHVAIAVVNLPVERDRRVIRETKALEAAGYRVTVICPRGEKGLKVVPGTRDAAIRSFRQPWAGSGVLSFAVEFLWAFVAVGWHVSVLLVTRRLRAVQVCNPPDVFWPLALVVRLFGVKWVYDHHDLNPELYVCKMEEGPEEEHREPNKLVLGLLKFFEKMSVRCATEVTTTNESYKKIAIERDGAKPRKVTVVRNGPATTEIAARPSTAAAQSRPQVVYLGVMGPQDRVDLAVLAAERLAELRSPHSFEMVIAGDGDCMPDLRRLVDERNLHHIVRFTGWLDAVQVDEVLAAAAIGIQPDPPTDMAHLSTMAKTIEYLARGVPVVAADLLETHRSAEDAAVYVPEATPEAFAKAIDALLDDAAQRERMRATALRRFREVLAWEHQAAAYIGVWRRLVPLPGDAPRMPRQRGGSRDVSRTSDVAASER